MCKIPSWWMTYLRQVLKSRIWVGEEEGMVSGRYALLMLKCLGILIQSDTVIVFTLYSDKGLVL